ncbi:MAG: hypothetical protein IJU54_02005 [Alphaproteobacteria bacterium]|nr:hypothetical protein [Alphaproteobacteria bacterium]
MVIKNNSKLLKTLNVLKGALCLGVVGIISSQNIMSMESKGLFNININVDDNINTNFVNIGSLLDQFQQTINKLHLIPQDAVSEIETLLNQSYDYDNKIWNALQDQFALISSTQSDLHDIAGRLNIIHNRIERTSDFDDRANAILENIDTLDEKQNEYNNKLKLLKNITLEFVNYNEIYKKLSDDLKELRIQGHANKQQKLYNNSKQISKTDDDKDDLL